MTTAKACGPSNVERTACMIELIIADVRTSFAGAGGGGITQIKADSSTAYTVFLSQEGRIDLVTYEFDMREGAVAISKRTPGTRSY